MTSFFIKSSMALLLFAGPYILLLVHFAIEDPFRLDTYPPYVDGYHHINRGVATTNGYLRSAGINAVIFGNSRSISIRCDDWTELSGTCDSCFHFDASSDNLHGFNQKANLLKQRHDSIDCALIVLDAQSLTTNPLKQTFPFVRHPAFGEMSHAEFYSVFIKQYLHLKYQYAHLTRAGRGGTWVSDFNYNESEFNPVTGDYITGKEAWIREDSIGYYENNPDFANREIKSSFDIDEEQLDALEQLVLTLENLGAHCTLLFQPRYSKEHPSLSTKDAIAKRLPRVSMFDATHLDHILDEDGLWYEQSHFRPSAGRSILEAMHSGDLAVHKRTD